MYHELTTCCACGSPDLRPSLDLGMIALADFPLPGEEVERAPLALQQCARCDLVQLSHAVERDRLYRNYYYHSGLNEAMIVALRDVVNDAMTRVTLGEGDRVLDIGANDGTLLKQYPDWLRRDGFEPSSLQAEVHQPDIHVWHDYFPSEFLRPVQPSYKIVSACAMFYDLEQPWEFLEEVKRWLHPNGIFVLQMPDLRVMLTRNLVDNICHEHLCYWPTPALLSLARTVGLQVTALSHNEVNGGSVRYTFRHCEPGEARWGAVDSGYRQDLERFGQRAEANKAATVTLIRGLRKQGKSVWGYGASTKGNTLLQYYGLGPGDIEAVADRNPDKVLRTMANGIPIVSEDCFRRHAPDFALVLPWAFLPAFQQREADWLRAGRFIQPLPRLTIVGGTTNGNQQQAFAPTETWPVVSP